MRALPTIAAITLVAACTDPSFDVKIAYEVLTPEVLEDKELQGQIAELTVSVIDAEAAGVAAGLGHDAECDDVAFGRIDAQVLQGARRASASVLENPRISGVPRLGVKLVIAEGRSEGGRLFGAGCTRWEDVDSDAEVPVFVEVAPVARLFTRESSESESEAQAMRVVVTAPWDDLVPLGGRAAIAELHTKGAPVVETPLAVTSDDGVTNTPGFTLGEPGPAQTLVRVRWAEDVLRVPSFRTWPTVATTNGARITLSTSPANSVDPSWVVGRPSVMGDVTWAAAGLQVSASTGAEEILVAFRRVDNGRLQRVVIPAPGIRTQAFWASRIVTIRTTSWEEIGMDLQLESIAGAATSMATPASELHVLRDCNGGTEDGLIVRHTNGGSGVYRAYTGFPPQPAAADHALTLLAAALDAAQETIFGSACVTLDDGTDVRPELRVVLARGAEFGLTAWSSSTERLMLPSVVTAAQFGINGRSFAAGAAATIRGSVVSSFKLADLVIGGGVIERGFVTNDLLDAELATAPTSFDVAELDNDDKLVVVAALPTLVGPRLQVNLPQLAGDQPLTSISEILPGGRGATNAIVRFDQVVPGGRPELLMMSDEGIDIYCLDVISNGNGDFECAPPR